MNDSHCDAPPSSQPVEWDALWIRNNRRVEPGGLARQRQETQAHVPLAHDAGDVRNVLHQVAPLARRERATPPAQRAERERGDVDRVDEPVDRARGDERPLRAVRRGTRDTGEHGGRTEHEGKALAVHQIEQVVPDWRRALRHHEEKRERLQQRERREEHPQGRLRRSLAPWPRGADALGSLLRDARRTCARARAKQWLLDARRCWAFRRHCRRCG